MNKGDFLAAANHHGRSTRLNVVSARSSVGDSDLVEVSDRFRNRLCPVIDVVGEPDSCDPGFGQCRGRDIRIGEETLDVCRSFIEPRREATFEIGENQIGREQSILHTPERNMPVGDVHQVDIARDNQLEHLVTVF